LGAGYALVRLVHGEPSAPGSTDGAQAPMPEVASYCGAGLEAIPGGCLAVPPGTGRTAPTPLRARSLPASQREESEALLGRQTRQAPLENPKRNRGPSPTRSPATASGGPQLATSSAPAAALRARLGQHHQSAASPGYFASLIAVRSLMAFDAIAIARAGAGGAVKANGAKPSILLLTADEDPSIESMIAFDAELSREAWPHALASRDGGHEVTDSDVATALVFFPRAPTRPLRAETRSRPRTTTSPTKRSPRSRRRRGRTSRDARQCEVTVDVGVVAAADVPVAGIVAVAEVAVAVDLAAASASSLSEMSAGAIVP
jgi:hypothetical protein